MRHPLHLPFALGCAAVLTLLTAPPSWAQTTTKSSIYTCVDAQGRRITSDRPIPNCLDREQRELSPSGSVRRVIPPEPTADERAALEAKRKEEAERQSRLNEEHRRERLLVARFPNEAAHQRERNKALESVDAVEAAIHKRIEELVKLRSTLDEEMAFYTKDPSKAPAILKRRIKDNESLVAAQQNALKQQAAERQRIAERYDAELAQLRSLWAGTPPTR